MLPLNIASFLFTSFSREQLDTSTRKLAYAQKPDLTTHLVCCCRPLMMSPPPSSEDNGPKLAVKGFSLSLLSKNGADTSRKATPTTNLNRRVNGSASSGSKSSLGKRARGPFTAGDRSDDSDSEHEGAFRSSGLEGKVKDEKRGAYEEVSGLEHGRVVLKGEHEVAKGSGKGDLVIPKIKNKDWRAEVRARTGGIKGKNLLPPEVQAQQAAEAVGSTLRGAKAEGVDVVNSQDGEIKWGLSVRKTQAGQGKQEVLETAAEETVRLHNGTEETKLQTADEEALSALLGQQTEKKGPDLIIPVASNTTVRITEEDAYRRAIREAPEASTLEDYERVPVEEFGAALLRGMGWKGEKKEGAKEIKRRQNLLGLGAKELKGAEELGAWVQKSDVKRLNTGKENKNSPYSGERRPKASEYVRERDRRREEREERGGGGYRREREREREREYRDGDRRRWL